MTELSFPARARLLTSGLGRAVLEGRGVAHELLRRALGRRLEPSERAWIDRIERRRRDLEASPEVVPFNVPGAPGTREVAELCRTSSQSRAWAELELRLLRAVRPRSCLELGSCLGISASYQGAALDLNEAGRLVTVEGHPAVAAIAAETVQRLGLDDRVECRVGWFDDVLEEVLSELGEVDYALVDGHHQREATLSYFARIRGRLTDRAIVVFDDIDWSSDMRAAWHEITADPGTADAVDLGRLGVWVAAGAG